MKYKEPCPGFELRTPSLFPPMITITLFVPLLVGLVVQVDYSSNIREKLPDLVKRWSIDDGGDVTAYV